MKKLSKKKVLLVVIAIIFLCFNAVWFYNWYGYKKAGGKIGYSIEWKGYTKRENGYVYAVFPPKYLSFTGNYSISQSWHAGDARTYGMIIWPKFGGGYEVGICILNHSLNEEKSKDNEIYYQSEEIQILLDEFMNPIGKDSKETLEENQDSIDAIRDMYDKAYKTWGILKIED